MSIALIAGRGSRWAGHHAAAHNLSTGHDPGVAKALTLLGSR